MNGISGGTIDIIASTQNSTYQYITVDDDITTFNSNTNSVVNIIAYASIYVNYNMIISKNVDISTYGSSGNIIFNTKSLQTSIIINSLPVSIRAMHSTSNITLSIPIILNNKHHIQIWKI